MKTKLAGNELGWVKKNQNKVKLIAGGDLNVKNAICNVTNDKWF